MELKCIIIDDEPAACETLERYINMIRNIVLVATAHNVDEGAEAIVKYSPDIVFLDIEMPGGSGFNLFDKVRSKNFEVIFTTAHDKHATKAFHYSAIHYLLKPIKLNEFSEAIDRVVTRKQVVFNQQRLELLLENLRNNTNEFKKIALSDENETLFVNVNDIIKINADGSYTFVYILGYDSPKHISKSLADFERLLPEGIFYRVEDSWIINLNFLSSYNKKDMKFVVMKDGSQITVSTRKRAGFLETVKKISSEKK